jgi:hypothetical protein
MAGEERRVVVDIAESGHIERARREAPREGPREDEIGLEGSENRFDSGSVGGDHDIDARFARRGIEGKMTGDRLRAPGPDGGDGR